MPMHDWTRVDPNDYHHFHLAWIAALAHALNTGRLPPVTTRWRNTRSPRSFQTY